MEVFNITNSSQDDFYDYVNNKTVDDDHKKISHIMNVVTCIIISVGLPLTLVAIYALYSMVRGDHVVLIYIINLLISNLIQFCCMIVEMATDMEHDIEDFFHSLCQLASVGFMVCIALERYLVITCPLWYRFRRTIKISVAVSVAVWVLSLALSLPLFLGVSYMAEKILFSVFLLPLPLLIFFLGGTIRALSASRVPSDEKRRIVGILALVLLIYTLLLLPSIMLVLAEEHTIDAQQTLMTLNNLSAMFVRLSPLADLVLYVFMRKGIIDKLLAAVCCCRMDSNDSNRTKSNDSRMNSNNI